MSRNRQADRLTAAYEVLKCAVLDGILNLTLRRILVMTLNVDGIIPDSDLERRRSLLQTEMSISTRNNYLVHEDEAYLEFATLLLSLEKSPCQERGPVTADRMIQMALDEARRREKPITIEIPLAPLLEQLLAWYVQSFPQTREFPAIAESILGLLPGVQPFVSELPPTQALQVIVERLIQAGVGTSRERGLAPPVGLPRFTAEYIAKRSMYAIFDFYDDRISREGRQLRKELERSETSTPPRLPPSEVLRLFGVVPIRSVVQIWSSTRAMSTFRKIQAISLGFAIYPIPRPLLSVVYTTETIKAYEARANSLSALAEVMGNYENTQSWAKLFDPPLVRSETDQ